MIKVDQDLLSKTIADSESVTSGEIKVYIEQKCPVKDPVERAVALFDELELFKTEKRNAVLIYLAYKDKKISIIGDQGINDVIPIDFWNNIIEVMQEHFKNKDFNSGFTDAIRLVGEKLRAHFPPSFENKNEISNEIVINH